MNITKIGVIGAGQMGHGIALVAAISGFDVRLVDDPVRDKIHRRRYIECQRQM